VTPCGLSNRARKDTTLVVGVGSATVAKVGGECLRRRGTAGFRRAAFAQTWFAVHGAVDPVLPRGSAGVSMDAK